MKVTKYIAEQWDIDRLELIEERIRSNNYLASDDLRLISYDLRAEIQKLKRQKK